jgi:hypothetical protein
VTQAVKVRQDLKVIQEPKGTLAALDQPVRLVLKDQRAYRVLLGLRVKLEDRVKPASKVPQERLGSQVHKVSQVLRVRLEDKAKLVRLVLKDQRAYKVSQVLRVKLEDKAKLACKVPQEMLGPQVHRASQEPRLKQELKVLQVRGQRVSKALLGCREIRG